MDARELKNRRRAILILIIYTITVIPFIYLLINLLHKGENSKIIRLADEL